MGVGVMDVGVVGADAIGVDVIDSGEMGSDIFLVSFGCQLHATLAIGLIHGHTTCHRGI